MKAIRGLLNSRKFWLMMMDVVLAIIALYVFEERALLLVGILQAPVIFVINAITREDVAALQAGTHPNQITEITGS